LFALLWIPILVRWSRAVRDAGKAFREGLDGHDGPRKVLTHRTDANVSTGAMREDRSVKVSPILDPEHPGILDAWDGAPWIGPDGLRPPQPAEEDEPGG
jgi:hypothetical protein